MRKTIFFLCLLVLSTGCASYLSLPKDTERLAHNRIKKQEQKGLVIAAEDYSEPRKCRRYFYRDLLLEGYIPIYICIGNNGDYEFTIRRENVIFRYEDGTQAKAA